MIVAQDWFEYHELKAKGVPALPPDTSRTQTQKEDNSVDLGDVYDTIDTALGGWLPGGVPLGSVTPTGGVPALVGPSTAPVATPTFNTTVAAAAPGAAPASIPRGYCYKMTPQGPRWVKERKRRCKRLITASQARDLEVIMAICGKGSKLTQIIVAKGGLC